MGALKKDNAKSTNNQSWQLWEHPVQNGDVFDLETEANVWSWVHGDWDCNITYAAMNLDWNYKQNGQTWNDQEGTELAYMYLTVPLLFGYKATISDNFSLVVEGGLEVGASLMNVGSVVRLARMDKSRPYTGLLLGVEGTYKRVSFGARGHFGLNNFEDWTFTAIQEIMYLRHIGCTVYLGYKLWDSNRLPKKKRRD